MQENYRTGMVDPVTRVEEYLGRHRRTTGTHRREVVCKACNGTGRRFVEVCLVCKGSALVPMPAVTSVEPTTYTAAHRADGPSQ